jgi:hypothetical protein
LQNQTDFFFKTEEIQNHLRLRQLPPVAARIPALIFDGLTVVVSPLIALMKDQVEQMRAAGPCS